MQCKWTGFEKNNSFPHIFELRNQVLKNCCWPTGCLLFSSALVVSFCLQLFRLQALQLKALAGFERPWETSAMNVIILLKTKICQRTRILISWNHGDLEATWSQPCARGRTSWIGVWGISWSELWRISSDGESTASKAICSDIQPPQRIIFFYPV